MPVTVPWTKVILRPWTDPLTGDRLKPTERFSWLITGLIRRWKFVAAYVTLSIVWWTHPQWFGDTLNYTHWQLGASLGALLIESVVGIGVFSIARRDSVYIRKIHNLERKAEQNDENTHVILHELLRITRQNEIQLKLLRKIDNGQTEAG